METRKTKVITRPPKDKNFQTTNAIQMDILKGYSVPLASDTLELPSTEDILDRARGMAYEYQLTHAVGPNVPDLVYAGLEALKFADHANHRTISKVSLHKSLFAFAVIDLIPSKQHYGEMEDRLHQDYGLSVMSQHR